MRTDAPHLSIRNPQSAIRNRSAFSLIEIMVVVLLLSVIILGLVAMFHQVQTALMGAGTQSDILEAGRATADELAREIEQMTPSYWNDTNAPNFASYIEQRRDGTFSLLTEPLIGLTDPLTGSTETRTNLMEYFFFVSRSNLQWTATGYVLDRPDLGVATLYRTNYDLSTNFINLRGNPTNLAAIRFAWADFYNNVVVPANQNLTPLTNYCSRIADGVVHLRLRSYDPNGLLITQFFPSPPKPNIYAQTDFNNFPGDNVYKFTSNAVPAFVELELGVLEPRTYERFKVLNGNPPAALQFLTNHSAQVHLFRQRIPIRNVDPSAY